MKIIFKIVFLILFCCTFCNGQKIASKFNIIDGPLEEQKRSYFGNVVCAGDDYFIITRHVRNKILMEKLGSGLQVIKSIDVTEFKDTDGKERKYGTTIFFNEKVFLVTSKTIRKKSITNYYQEIDPVSFELNQTTKILSETDLTGKRRSLFYVDFLGNESSKRRVENAEAGTDILFSPDGNKVLIYTKKINSREGPDCISVKVQNQNFETEWENDSIALPYNSLLFDIELVKLNNKGDVFLSGLEFNAKRKSKVKDNPNYKYHLIGFFNHGKEVKDYEISLENKFITACQFQFDGDKYIIVAGFYSENSTQNVKGAFFLKVNVETRAIENVKMKPFDFNFIVSGMSEREQEKQKKKAEKGQNVEMLNFYLDDIIVNENGTYNLIAEQFYVYTYQTYSPGMNGQAGIWTTHYVYTYNDIIVVNMSTTGDINWMTKINKYQRTTDDGGANSSYVCNNIHNKIYLLYNDHPDNLTQTDESKFKTYRPGRETAQVIVEIDENGKMTKELLFKSERGEVELKPKQCRRNAAGDIFLYSGRRKEYQFTLLDFK